MLMRKRLFLSVTILLLLAGCSNQGIVTVKVQEDSPVANTSTVSSTAAAGQNIKTSSEAIKTTITADKKFTVAPVATSTGKEVGIPAQVQWPVLFASQAPLSNWDALHEEACEEASMIMTVKYFKKLPLNNNIMEDEIQRLIKWETDNGYSVDLDAAEVVRVMKDYFDFNVRISRDVNTDQIKYELAKGNLIIIPAAGRDLHNPNFKAPGPIYHMLVIKGYNNSQFITNDPGTRKGNGYRYDYATLIGAVHDWNHDLASGGMTDEEMRQGEKVMIIVSRP
jgi:uncharacterized protein YcfL